MMAQIGVVLATYWRRTVCSPFVMLAVIVPVIGIVEALLWEKKQIAMATWMGIYGPALIALHFKQQIIQISQRRIPNAVAAHVIVTVGLLVLCGVGLPAARMAIGIWSWGALGFVLALTAVTFALFAVQTGRLLVLITPFIFMACFDSVQKWLEELCQRRHEAFGLPLLAAGICGIAATLAWLLQRSEEDAGYFGRLDLRSYPRCEPSTDYARTRAASWLCRLGTPSERKVQLWPQWARGSRWQRIRLWSVGSNDVFPLWLIPVTFFVFLLCVGVMLPAGQRSIIMKSNVFFMIYFPVFTMAGTMWQQRRFAATESLRPVERSQFFIEMGLAYAYRVAVAWVLFSIEWCGLVYVFASDAPVWSEMVNLLVLTAAFQVFFFGLVVWVTRFVPFITWFALFAFGFGVVMLPWFRGYDWRNASFGALLWVSPGIVAAGALITWDAYRRWMQTEMG